MEFRLPYPALVVLVGPAGAGKTTFSRRFFERTQIVSSDECRRLVSDTEDFHPDRTAAAFRTFYFLIEERLRLGRLTVADSTGLIRRARAPLLELAKRYDLPAYAVVFDIPLEQCLARDRSRGRQVGRRVLARQFEELRVARMALPLEGFAGTFQVDPLAERGLELVIDAQGLVRPPDRLTVRPPRPLGHGTGHIVEEDFVREARVQLEEAAPQEEELQDARKRLGTVPDDLPWQLSIPAPFAPAPVETTDPDDCYDEVVERLKAAGFRRGLFRACSAGERALAIFSRTQEAAADLLGAAPDSGTGRLILPEWNHGPRPGLSSHLAEVGADLADCTAFWRCASDIIALDCHLMKDEEGHWRLAPLGLNLPNARDDAKDPEFFWDWLEVDAYSIAMGQTERFAADAAMLEDGSLRAWWDEQVAEGREILLVAASNCPGNGDEAPWLGYTRPGWQLWPIEEVGCAERARLRARRLFALRRLAQRAFANADIEAARQIVEYAWALEPKWRTADQEELFEWDEG
ncbi:AAA family ATPase [bacterium]|nr:AAA family ATPase [bacterium]